MSQIFQSLYEYDGWYFRVYVRLRLLRREYATRGWVGWLPALLGGLRGEGSKIARRGSPFMMPPNSPTGSMTVGAGA